MHAWYWSVGVGGVVGSLLLGCGPEHQRFLQRWNDRGRMIYSPEYMQRQQQRYYTNTYSYPGGSIVCETLAGPYGSETQCK